MKKFINALTKNLPYKIGSVLIAVIIWYAVVYNSDPIITQKYDVRIQIENEAFIVNGKRLYLIEEQYKTVTVYVKGNRSQLKNINRDNIKVTADFTQIVDFNSKPITVPLQVSLEGFDMSSLSLSRSTIPITIENVASKELQVSPLTGDGTVDKNFEIGKMTVNPSSITISGPESIINSIESVVAKIDVSGLRQDKEVNGKLTFIDASQNEVADSIINDDINVEGGMPDVKVNVELWKKVNDIALEVKYSGNPEAGYQVGTVTTTPERLTLAGSQEALAALAEAGNKVTIPYGYVDISGASTDIQKEVEIEPLLPKDTKLSASMNKTVIVSITIMPYGSLEFGFDVDNISINNLDMSKYVVSYDKQEINIRINSEPTISGTITESSISASIDLNGYTAGDYTVPVSVNLPTGATLINNVNVSIHIKEKT